MSDWGDNDNEIETGREFGRMNDGGGGGYDNDGYGDGGDGGYRRHEGGGRGRGRGRGRGGYNAGGGGGGGGRRDGYDQGDDDEENDENLTRNRLSLPRNYERESVEEFLEIVPSLLKSSSYLEMVVILRYLLKAYKHCLNKDLREYAQRHKTASRIKQQVYEAVEQARSNIEHNDNAVEQHVLNRRRAENLDAYLQELQLPSSSEHQHHQNRELTAETSAAQEKQREAATCSGRDNFFADIQSLPTLSPLPALDKSRASQPVNVSDICRQRIIGEKRKPTTPRKRTAAQRSAVEKNDTAITVSRVPHRLCVSSATRISRQLKVRKPYAMELITPATAAQLYLRFGFFPMDYAYKLDKLMEQLPLKISFAEEAAEAAAPPTVAPTATSAAATSATTPTMDTYSGIHQLRDDVDRSNSLQPSLRLPRALTAGDTGQFSITNITDVPLESSSRGAGVFALPHTVSIPRDATASSATEPAAPTSLGQSGSFSTPAITLSTPELQEMVYLESARENITPISSRPLLLKMKQAAGGPLAVISEGDEFRRTIFRRTLQRTDVTSTPLRRTLNEEFLTAQALPTLQENLSLDEQSALNATVTTTVQVTENTTITTTRAALRETTVESSLPIVTTSTVPGTEIPLSCFSTAAQATTTTTVTSALATATTFIEDFTRVATTTAITTDTGLGQSIATTVAGDTRLGSTNITRTPGGADTGFVHDTTTTSVIGETARDAANMRNANELAQQMSQMTIVNNVRNVQNIRNYTITGFATPNVPAAPIDDGYRRDWFEILRVRSDALNYAVPDIKMIKRRKRRRVQRILDMENQQGPPAKRRLLAQNAGTSAEVAPATPDSTQNLIATLLFSPLQQAQQPQSTTSSAPQAPHACATASPQASQAPPPFSNSTPQNAGAMLHETWQQQKQKAAQAELDSFLIENSDSVAAIMNNLSDCLKLLLDYKRLNFQNYKNQNAQRADFDPVRGTLAATHTFNPDVLLKADPERLELKLAMIQEMIRCRSFDITKIPSVHSRLQAARAFSFALELKAINLINLSSDGRTVALK